MGKGPVLLKCPACGDKLTLFCPVWFAVAVLTGIGVVALIVNFTFMPDHVPPLAVLGSAIAEGMFGWAVGKHMFDLWRKFWFWRHPARCTHDRGHLVPATSHA